MRAVYESLSGDGYLAPGMLHNNFSDAPLYSPLMSRLGITGLIDGDWANSIQPAGEPGSLQNGRSWARSGEEQRGGAVIVILCMTNTGHKAKHLVQVDRWQTSDKCIQEGAGMAEQM